MAVPTFLIVGATGKQGGSVIDALLALPSANFHILALTRNTESSSAKRLAAKPRVSVIQGDPMHPEPLFQKAAITGVFCVTVHGKEGAEEAQAEGLIDASIKHDVKHFVFASADRGGDAISDENPTPVPHIATKYRIEKYLKEKSAGTSMAWTMLRPVTFMDNLTPDFVGKGFAAMWNQVGDHRVQLVHIRDIGHFGALALTQPEQYAGRSIGIAGDALTFAEACEIFKQVTGEDMPTTFCVVGSILKKAMPDMGAMFKWFETDGYGVDIKACRAEYPELQDFATWLRKSNGFVKK